MPVNFTPVDIKMALAESDDPKVVSYSNESEVVLGVWNILLVSVDLMADAKEGKGSLGGQSIGKFAVKKVISIANVANINANNQGVRVATFVGGTLLTSVEMGVESLKYTSAAKAGIFITLKSAEKVLGAAGLANLDKCKLALASLTLSAGTSTFTCVATGGALCILGAASFALEAWNAHEQCSIPPV